MTIDERLDRLAERHEAMAQTVELMIHQQRDWHERAERRFEEDKRRWELNERSWQLNERSWQHNEEWLRKNQILMAEATENIHALARIAQSHERRITDLERPQG